MQSAPHESYDSQDITPGSSATGNLKLHRLLLFLMALLNWLCISAYTVGLLEIHSAVLVLKPESCALMHRLGIAVQPLDSSGTCTTTVRFRQHMTGGTVYVGDQTVRLADNQVIAAAAISTDEQWTDHQAIWVAGWGISTALLLMLIVISLSRRRKK